MGKAKQKKKISQLKRKQMIEEVFKKGKKQRDIAKKFDEKMVQKYGSSIKKDKIIKQQKKSAKNATRDEIVALNKKLDQIRGGARKA